jgi:hypothetical protein
VITVRAEPTQASNGVTTGGLNEHRESVAGHVTAMCIVLPATPVTSTGST